MLTHTCVHICTNITSSCSYTLAFVRFGGCDEAERNPKLRVLCSALAHSARMVTVFVIGGYYPTMGV